MVHTIERNICHPVCTIAVFLLLLAGCSGGSNSDGADTAVVRLHIGGGSELQRQGVNGEVQIRLEVSTGAERERVVERDAACKVPPITVVFPITIPADVRTFFKVEVLNSNGEVVFKGESSLKLPPGEATEDLPIALVRVAAPEPPSIPSDQLCNGGTEPPPLAVTLRDDPDPVAVNQPLTYNLTVTNPSPAQQATDVTLTNDLPAGVRFVEATPSQGSCAEADGTVTCSLGDLAPGDSAMVTIRVTPTVPGTLTNTATVIATNFTPGTDSEDTIAIGEGPPPPVVTVSCTAVNEGAPSTIEVTLLEASTQPITVDFTTADRSATAGQDYEATSGTLRFPPGTIHQSISVPTLDDTAVESNEAFVVTLSNPLNARLDADQGECTLTILDNDFAVFAVGTGLADPSGPATTGTMTLHIPNNSPFRAFLSWQQRDRASDGVDPRILFGQLNNGQRTVSVPGQLASDRDSRCFLAEITDLIEPGTKTYTVSGVDNENNPGAGIVVITAVLDPSAVLGSVSDETLDTVIEMQVGSESPSTRRVEVKAGCDFFFRGTTEVMTFEVDPASFERHARVILFVGDAEPPSSSRGNDILFFAGTGTPPTSLLDAMGKPINGVISLGRDATGLVANAGDAWDTFGRNSGILPPNPGLLPTNDPDLRGDFMIPAGATFVSLQLLSPAERHGVSGIVSLAVLEIVGPSGTEALTP